MVDNWLITGGCGFIGTSLIKKILELNPSANIRVLDDLSVGTKSDLAEVSEFSEHNFTDIAAGPVGVELVVGDIRLAENVNLACKGVECIVHLAANTGVAPSVDDPKLDLQTNVIGTFNALESARYHKVSRFVFASSGAPIGELDCPPIHEELAPHPVSPYGASKLAGEGYCSAYKRSFGLDTVALRFGNVYGPGSVHKSSVVAKFIRQALEGQSLEIYGDGSQTRDFIFIEDLTKAILLAATKGGIGGEVFQIASNRETTVGEMTEELVEILCQKGIEDISIFNGETRVGDVMRNYSDTTKARDLLEWQPEISLTEGLIETIDYFLNQRKGL